MSPKFIKSKIASNILVNKDATARNCTAISNSGTLNINNESIINVGIESTSNEYKGIVSLGEGQTTINNAQITLPKLGKLTQGSTKLVKLVWNYLDKQSIRNKQDNI